MNVHDLVITFNLALLFHALWAHRHFYYSSDTFKTTQLIRKPGPFVFPFSFFFIYFTENYGQQFK